MNTYISNIIFDFDGTLVDTAPLIITTMQATIKELKLGAKSDDECRSTIGLRLEDIPSVLWPDEPEKGKHYASTYRRIFERLKRPLNVSCYPGVVETLRRLNEDGYRLAIASSRSHRSLDEYIHIFNMDDIFDDIVGGDDISHGKPAPDPVIAICSKLGWDTDNTMVVGDATVDIKMGKNAGTLTCGVTYGNQTGDLLKTANPDFIADCFPVIYPIIYGVDNDIANYVEKYIIPRYETFDKAHRCDHVKTVISQSLRLSKHLPEIDRNMAYIIAAYHDLGLVNGREYHHIDSAKILKDDPFIKKHFTDTQISVMADAIEDHRASNKSKPRSNYGLIVAEADRCIDPETIIRRTIQYGLANYPDLDKAGQIERTREHLENKYGPNGYLKIRIPWSDNAVRLKRLHTLLSDTELINGLIERIYSEEA